MSREELTTRLAEQVAEETADAMEYDHLAEQAESLGYRTVGHSLRSIATDERRHASLLNRLIHQITTLPGVGDISAPTHLHRPFPQTYSDWEVLGQDIVTKDYRVGDEVYYHLSQVYGSTPESESSKRWLMAKSAELGLT